LRGGERLVPFLPGHLVMFDKATNAVSAAPYGSAGVLEITYAYIKMMGADGLTGSDEDSHSQCQLFG